MNSSNINFKNKIKGRQYRKECIRHLIYKMEKDCPDAGYQFHHLESRVNNNFYNSYIRTIPVYLGEHIIFEQNNDKVYKEKLEKAINRFESFYPGILFIEKLITLEELKIEFNKYLDEFILKNNLQTFCSFEFAKNHILKYIKNYKENPYEYIEDAYFAAFLERKFL